MASSHITISDSSDESYCALNTPLRSTPRKRKFSSHITISDESNCEKRTCCGSTSSSDNDLDDGWTALSCNSSLLNTIEKSDSSFTSSNEPQSDEHVSNLDMEILMMREIFEIMPTTSSPISKRRGIPITNYVGYTRPSDRYSQWRKNLYKTPTFSIRHLPGLLEAEAGQFSPLSYCAYTSL